MVIIPPRWGLGRIGCTARTMQWDSLRAVLFVLNNHIGVPKRGQYVGRINLYMSFCNRIVLRWMARVGGLPLGLPAMCFACCHLSFVRCTWMGAMPPSDNAVGCQRNDACCVLPMFAFQIEKVDGPHGRPATHPLVYQLILDQLGGGIDRVPGSRVS
jgi:hypothetical protein